MNLQLGRHIYGLAAVVFGITTFVWHDFNTWQQIRALGNIPGKEILLYMIATAEIVGGIAIQWNKTARYGAIILGTVYLIFALLWVPFIIAKPLAYDSWGNFFEQFSLVSGALIVYGLSGRVVSEKIARIGYLCFGVCVISFTLEQIFYFKGTESFVPAWFPPGKMFWAIVTTIAFALAAISLLSRRWVLLSSRLLTIMILGFCFFLWFPALFNDPHQQFNWAANAQNLGITGSAWIVADFVYGSKRKVIA